MSKIMEVFILDEITKELNVSKAETIGLIKNGTINLSDEEMRYAELDDLYIVSIEGKEKIKKYFKSQYDKTDEKSREDVLEEYKNAIDRAVVLFTGFGLVASLYKAITELIQEDK